MCRVKPRRERGGPMRGHFQIRGAYDKVIAQV
jgi:hypothetical protein